MSSRRKIDGPVYNSKELGIARQLELGFQFMCAMFAGNILVAIIVGLDVGVAMFTAGIGTLFYHFITKWKVPVFLGSSFALMIGYQLVSPEQDPGIMRYAMFGIFIVGIIYVIFGQLIRIFGAKRVMKLFPPVVTGPVIICIAAGMAANQLQMSQGNWVVAIVGIVVVVVCSMFGKGMIKILPIMIGLIAAYVVAIIMGEVDFTPVREAAWIGHPFTYSHTMVSLFTEGNVDGGLLLSATLTCIPLCIASLVEHIGDTVAVGTTVGKNFIKDPGLHRTLAGDGIATSLASLFGGPGNTTFTEGTATLSLTQVYDPVIVRIAAIMMVILSFCPKLAAVIASIPDCAVGGVAIIMYATLGCVGFRSLVHGKVNFDKTRNVLIVGLIFVLTIGIKYGLGGGIAIPLPGGRSFSLSSMALGAIVGIVLNLVLPDADPDTTLDAFDDVLEEAGAK